MSEVSPRPDRIIRAITDDGAFRVITLASTESVRAAIAKQKEHGANGELAPIFADLLTAAVLVRESMAPDLRVQVILQSADHKSRIVVDAQPDGSCRGVLLLPAADANVAPSAEVFTGEGALLQVARTLQTGAIQQGVVSVSGGVSEALMQYMQQSEQVVTMCAVGNLMKDGEVIAAGGYLVQLLPEVVEGPLMVMTERLKDFTSMDGLLANGSAEPETLMSELLYGMAYTKVAERSDLRFACSCSPTRVAATLATLPKSDIEDLLRDGRLLDIECDYCHTRYEFPPEQLRGMLEQN
jgi:molecular chaperone Hsp33